MKGKLFKRLVSGALALLMLGTALPPDSDFSGLFGIGITASAEAFSGKCGDNAWCEIEELEPEYGDPRYKLTIKGSGDMWDFSEEKYSPYRDNIGKIKEVVITKDITRIGDNAFSCSGQGVDAISFLDRVTFEENSKLEKIGENAFTDCPLEEITLPAGLKEIEDYAFSGCFRLATINCLVADPSELTLGDLSGDFIFEPKRQRYAMYQRVLSLPMKLSLHRAQKPIPMLHLPLSRLH